MSVYTLLSEIAQSITPSQEVFPIIEQTLKRINDRLQLHEVNAIATVGGSVAKGTFLRGDHDIDVFVRFEYQQYKDEDISDILGEVLKEFGPSRVHGSRDYFQFEQGALDFEVVPVLAITQSSQARNITDVSPLHVQYMKSQDVDSSEIRLAKQFCKANGVYGAESYIRGFSGHVLDLLLVEYSTFYELAKAVTRWEAPVVLDPARHHKNPLFAIEKSKHGPLVLVDPVQPLRNAAAALDTQKFNEFIDACRSFVRAPSADFFIIKDFDESEVRREVSKYPAWALVYLTHGEDDKQDVAGSRVRKTYERVCDELTRDDFSPEFSGWNFTYQKDSVLWFGFSSILLSETILRQGPPVSEEEHVVAFKQEHDDVFEEEGVLYTHVQREIRSPAQALTKALDTVTAQTGLDYEIVAGVLREQDQ